MKNKKGDADKADDYKPDNLLNFIAEAEQIVQAKIPELNTPFNVPEIKLLSLFIPAKNSPRLNA
jgi:hypothetical protein